MNIDPCKGSPYAQNSLAYNFLCAPPVNFSIGLPNFDLYALITYCYRMIYVVVPIDRLGCSSIMTRMEQHQRKPQEEYSRETVLILESLEHLSHQVYHIMSIISDFTTKLNVFFDRQDKAVSDLQGDVDNLTKQIAALQASAGTVTPEDQALLDGIQARASSVSDKLDALDALTPPVTPTSVSA